MAIAAATAVLGICGVAPLALLLVAPALAGRWDAYGSAIIDARQIQLLVNSTRMATGAAVLATATGAPLGFLLARAPIAGRNAVRLALAIPVVVPTYALALSWIFMGGAAGVVPISSFTYGPWGAVVVLALALYPISMLATEAAATRIESRLEEAALLVAPPRRALMRITLPILWPSVASSALLTFVLALADYSVPNLLRQRVFTTEVFTAFAALYDVSRATALALPLLAVALVVGYVVAPIGSSVLATGRPSAGIGIRFPRLGPAVAIVAAAVFSASVVLPLGMLTAEAGSIAAIKTALVRSEDAIGESLLLASVAATLASAVALVLGYGRGRWRHPAGRWADAALIALLAVPGTITGIGLIELWNRPGWIGGLYGTRAMLVIAYLARFVPVATVILSAAVRRVPRSSDEAAALSGAGWARTMWHIVVPQLALSLVVAWVVVFVLAFGEVGASVLVAPPGHAPFPVHVFTLIANAPSEQVAALALVQAAVVVFPFVLATSYASWSRTRNV